MKLNEHEVKYLARCTLFLVTHSNLIHRVTVKVSLAGSRVQTFVFMEN